MTTVSLKAQAIAEAKFLSILYPTIIVLGLGAAFVSHFTNFKIVTSGPAAVETPSLASAAAAVPHLPELLNPIAIKPQDPQQRQLPIEQRVWEYGFPDGVESMPMATLTPEEKTVIFGEILSGKLDSSTGVPTTTGVAPTAEPVIHIVPTHVVPTVELVAKSQVVKAKRGRSQVVVRDERATSRDYYACVEGPDTHLRPTVATAVAAAASPAAATSPTTQFHPCGTSSRAAKK